MSQGTMSKGPFSCHGKMRGPWDGYLGLGAATWLITCISLINASGLEVMLSIFLHQTLKLWEDLPVKG